MKKRSLLWQIEEPEREPDRALIRDLMLDNTIKDAIGTAMDAKTVNYFLNVLSRVPEKAENSVCRAEVFSDFQKFPLFFDRLSAAWNAFDLLPQQFQLEKSSISVHTAAKFGSDAKYRTSLGVLIMTANMIQTTFEQLTGILQILEKQPLESAAFRSLILRLHELIEHPSYARLKEILDLIASTPDEYLVELQFTLDEFGKIANYDVHSIDRLDLKIHGDLSKLRKKRRAPQISLNVPASIALSDPDNVLRNQLLGGIYNKMAEILNRVLSGLLTEFSGVSVELSFYRVALYLVQSFDRYGIPYCAATPVSDRPTEIHGLKDLVLSLSSYGQKTVIGNDAIFPSQSGGILIRGENNSGKTVYLRALATALVFAQNGLPVLARSAQIFPQHSIRTLFASAEKAVSVGAGVGRFEEEVRALSETVDQVQSGDLIFLNEIFQTTAYEEGAKGLADVLRYLNALGASWICVTHLGKLFRELENDPVTMLETTDPDGETPYQLREIKKSRKF